MVSRRRAYRGGSRSRGPRRASEWEDTQINETVDADQQFSNLTTSMADDLKKGLTLVRTIIDLTVAQTVAGTGANMAMGIYLAGTDAISALVFADPASSGEQPGWVWRKNVSSVTSLANDASQFVHVFADLKAKRRFPGEDYDMVLVLDGLGSAGSPINIDGMIRQLWLKP